MTPPVGILNVNKPAGCTSRDVVTRVVRLLGGTKCGHAGTLDPLATGVLVICVGQATRLIQYVQRRPKRYRAVFLLGQRSDTDDTEREVELLPDAPQPTRAAIEAALPQFVGEIRQRPPAHSAVQIGGRRAYDLARRGVDFEVPERTVTVHRFALLRYDYPELELEIVCGGGTYVRSLGRDLAASLGTVAVMSALERTAIGEFSVDEAVALDDLAEQNFTQHLQPALTAVADLPRIELDESQLTEIRHGRPIMLPPSGATGSASAATDKTGGSEGTGEASGTQAGGSSDSLPLPKGEGLETENQWAAINAAGQLVAILFEKRPGQLWPVMNLGG